MGESRKVLPFFIFRFSQQRRNGGGRAAGLPPQLKHIIKLNIFQEYGMKLQKTFLIIFDGFCLFMAIV
jgi:hypothetical protein